MSEGEAEIFVESFFVALAFMAFFCGFESVCITTRCDFLLARWLWLGFFPYFNLNSRHDLNLGALRAVGGCGSM